MVMNKQPGIIILLGRSGSGKGTQAKLLIEEFGFDYLGTGKLLRKRMETEDFTGKKLAKYVNKGERVPTHFVFQVWGRAIEELKEKPGLKGVIIDGSPRSLMEAKLMEGLFKWFEWKNIKVVLIDISRQEAFDRLTKRRYCVKCGRIIPWTGSFKSLKVCDQCQGELETRPDDVPEAINARMAYYKEKVEPAIEYYQKQKRLVKIDGEKTIEDVYRDVKKAL